MFKRSFLRHFRIYFWVSLITLGVLISTRVMFLELDQVDFVDLNPIREFGWARFVIVFDIVISFLVAFLSSLAEVTLLRKLFHRRMSIGLALFYDILIRLFLLMILLHSTSSFVTRFFALLGSPQEVVLRAADLVPMSIYLAFNLTLCGLIMEIDRKLGPGNLWKLLRGKFYKPTEEHRVFMFVDLRGSTRLAEELGHLQFSQLLRDCFQDFSIVDHFEAEIYQYVGDEVVISWPVETAFKNNNFLKAFYAFTDVLHKRSNYYLGRYGIEPYFKAGVHVGPIVVSEVGDIKREISYHGDTINTAARIQGLCNSLGAQLLISEEVYQGLITKKAFDFEDVGSLSLKGKGKEVRLYGVFPE